VSRFVAIVVHNWPLKILAIVLASLLYAGLVLSQSAQRWDSPVPIAVRNQPTNAVLVNIQPASVTGIRYFAPAGVSGRVSSETFQAFVDLEGVDPSVGSTFAAVQVRATDPRIQIVDFQPSSVRVELDPLTSKTVPIQVDKGTPPTGLQIGEAQLSVQQAVIRGPSSVVARVVAAVARVTIQPSGLNVDADIPLVAVDAVGTVVTPVDIVPETVHVKIRVGSPGAEKSVPVNPVIIGTPASGYEYGEITVTPSAVTVTGDASDLALLAAADTVPLSISGATADVTRTVDLALPANVDPVGATQVLVTVKINAVAGTQTFSAGLLLAGARDDRIYNLSTDRVTVVLGGPVSQLDNLDPATFTASVDVAALAPGVHQVPVVVGNLPVDLTAVSISPPTVTVTVSVPPRASPSPSPGGSASPGPSPSP
jgi:YbbR domain-containing protein